jgi:2-polyprenyl-6-methoxyphenol hydroxylase-like FAD-dependent oxidoreductase
MSPQLGVGAQLAMADARILASKLATSDSVAAALHDYSRTRPTAGKSMADAYAPVR